MKINFTLDVVDVALFQVTTKTEVLRVCASNLNTVIAEIPDITAIRPLDKPVRPIEIPGAVVLMRPDGEQVKFTGIVSRKPKPVQKPKPKGDGKVKA